MVTTHRSDHDGVNVVIALAAVILGLVAVLIGMAALSRGRPPTIGNMPLTAGSSYRGSLPWFDSSSQTGYARLADGWHMIDRGHDSGRLTYVGPRGSVCLMKVDSVSPTVSSSSGPLCLLMGDSLFQLPGGR